MKRALFFAAGGLFVAALIVGGYLWHTYRSSKPISYEGADAPSSAPLANKAPRLALVLSSGGGRGYAHVGVLKVLDEAGIKPDLIVGTSVGSLIGALYAAGLAPAEIERRALDFDYSALEDYTLSRYGQLKGEGVVRFVNDAVDARPIEALQIPLAIVATNLATGRTAVFTRGNTGVAVRASAASIGRIVPLRIGSAVYADGDLTSPLAVRAARRLGARRVIAVDVSADPAVVPFDEIPIEWTAEAVTRRALIDAESPDADVVVRPRLPYYVPHTRAYKEMAMRRGEEAAREALARLKAVAGAAPLDGAQDKP